MGPASVLRLTRARCAAGDDADITVLDLERRVVIDPGAFASKSVNTPFGGLDASRRSGHDHRRRPDRPRRPFPAKVDS